MLKLQENISLAEHTSFGIGGPARYFAEVESVDELKEAIKISKEKGIEFFILGGGSNVLVSDAGFPGLAVKVKLEKITKIDDENFKVGAGVLLSKLLNFSVENSLAGLEWAAGIPGTVGGAVVGNAGTPEGEMKDQVKNIEFFDIEKFQVFSLRGDECDFKYRSSYFKGKRNLILLSIEIYLEKGDEAKIKEKIEEIAKKRSEKQPSGRSAGSFFVNPVVGIEAIRSEFKEASGSECIDNKVPAGWFIERLGFKGKKIGGAQVSNEHANFIINTGNAKAEDFIVLASLIKQKVRDKYGVQLKEEVQYIGF